MKKKTLITIGEWIGMGVGFCTLIISIVLGMILLIIITCWIAMYTVVPFGSWLLG
jgi:hypothetical protein